MHKHLLLSVGLILVGGYFSIGPGPCLPTEVSLFPKISRVNVNNNTSPGNYHKQTLQQQLKSPGVESPQSFHGGESESGLLENPSKSPTRKSSTSYPSNSNTTRDTAVGDAFPKTVTNGGKEDIGGRRSYSYLESSSSKGPLRPLLPPPLLTNVKRQIGNSSENPIWNLHEKVNGQGGGQLNVTDVSSSLQEFEFTKTSSVSKGLSTELPLVVKKVSTASPLVSVAELLHNQALGTTRRGIVNVEEENVNSSSFAIRNNSVRGITAHFSTLLEGESPGATRKEIKMTENNRQLQQSSYENTQVDSIRRSDDRDESRIQNLKESHPFLDDETYFQSSSSLRIDTVSPKTTSTTKGVEVEDSQNSGLIIKYQEGLFSSCTPVIVNQTTPQELKNYTTNVMNKWTRTLVKISQCVADCMKISNNNSPNTKLMDEKKMSPKKGINELGMNNFPFPVGISSSKKTRGENYNGEEEEVRANLNDKVLSRCQKSCWILPLKSSVDNGMTPPSLETSRRRRRRRRVKLSESNNGKESDEYPSLLKKGKVKTNPNQKPISLKLRKEPKVDLEITKSDTQVFHLHWPKITPAAAIVGLSKANTKMVKLPFTSTTMIYNVVLENLDTTTMGGDERPRWKLIDQTVALQTQISLVAHVDVCQQLKLRKTLPKTITLEEKSKLANLKYQRVFSPNTGGEENQFKSARVALWVFAVSVGGLEKVLGGLLQIESHCCRKVMMHDRFANESYVIGPGGNDLHGGNHQQTANYDKGIIFPTKLKVVKEVMPMVSIQDHDQHEDDFEANKNSNNVAKEERINPKSSSEDGTRIKLSYKPRTDYRNIGKDIYPLSRRRFQAEDTTGNDVRSNTDETETKNKKSATLFDGKDKGNEIPNVENSSALKLSSSSWGVRMISMVYENFLVVTEVSWDLPRALSNHNDNHLDENGNKYQFLLTWEIFGGGLKGNLVTDMTTGTISLWPDTAYFIQVGLISPKKPDPRSAGNDTPESAEQTSTEGGIRTSSKSATSKNSNMDEEQHQNYMSNLLGLESIIFPLGDVDPKVVSYSERLLVNTSQLSIPKSSPPVPLPSELPTPFQQNQQKTSTTTSDSIKSNNPLLLQQEEHQERQGDHSGTNYHPRSYEKWKWNVSPIIIPSATVSKNGNENDHQHPQQHWMLDMEKHGHNHQLENQLRNRHKYEKKSEKKSGDEYYGVGVSSSNGYMNDSPGANTLEEPSSTHKVKAEVKGIENETNTGRPTNRSAVSGPNGHEDKEANINDHKNNNNLKPSNKKKKTAGGGAGRSGAAAGSDHHETIFRPDVYQGLFSLNMGLGGYNSYDSGNSGDASHFESNNGGGAMEEKFPYANRTNSHENVGPSVIYSVFVLIVVACVIFLFLVAFIGFFIVTSSISNTAHYFIPKRVRIFLIGENGESELLASSGSTSSCGRNHHHNHHDEENDTEDQEVDFNCRFYDPDDLDDNDEIENESNEWVRCERTQTRGEDHQRHHPVILTNRT